LRKTKLSQQSETKMITKYILTAALTAMVAMPAAAHDSRAHTYSNNAKVTNENCAHLASPWNMQKVERTFRAMPQSTRMNLQHVLRHAELYGGASDGIWGVGTECAMRAVAGRYSGNMSDADMVAFYEYMLDGGFVADYPGTPSNIPHANTLY
jgi:hypothetical protein